MTTSGTYLVEVDGLRFFAIAGVVVFHMYRFVFTHVGPQAGLVVESQGSVISLGAAGVNLFFAISGFVLALPFARAYSAGTTAPSRPAYYLRRLTRLEPPYVLWMIAVALARLTFRPDTMHDTLRHLGASLLYMHGLIYRAPSTINPVAWSLEIEVQFYLILPLLALVFKLRRPWLRRGVWVSIAAAVMAANLTIGRMSTVWTWTVFAYMAEFAAGLFVADLFVTEWRTSVPGRLWDALSLASFAAVAVAAAANSAAMSVVLPVCCFTFTVAAFRGQIFRSVVSNRWLGLIGGMCYSTYLVHTQVITAAGTWLLGRVAGAGWQTAFVGIVVCCTPAVLMASIAYFKVIEKPCMYKDWPQRVWSMRPQRSAAAAAGR